MNKRRWLLHVFERAHEPTPQAEERLQKAILEHVPDGRASQRLLGHLDGPSSIQERRLAARLSQIPEHHPRGRGMPAGLSWGRLAVAGVAALGLGLVMNHALNSGPEQLATTLEVRAEPADLAPFPGVHLAYHDGYGELGGTTRSPAIQWIAGELEVEVEPGRGIELSVLTEEATVRVIGTRFTVTRQDAETVVSVERGKVEVTCSDGEQAYLTAGERQRCASQSPSKLALRALRMQQRGAEPDKVLEVVERGLTAAQQGDAAWSHLSVLHMQALGDAGRSDEALEEAKAYLTAGHDRRRDEVLRFAMQISPEPCSLAIEHSAVLGSERASPADLVSLSDCLDGAEARALLQRVLTEPGLADPDRAAVQQRLDQLR